MESESFIIFYRNLTSAKCWVALNATPTPVHWENTWNLIALKSKNSTGEPKTWPTWPKDPLLPRPDTRLGHPDRPLLWTQDHPLSLRNNTCWLALLLCCKREVLWWLWKTCPVPRRPPRGCLVLWCHTSPGNPAKEVRFSKKFSLNVYLFLNCFRWKLPTSPASPSTCSSTKFSGRFGQRHDSFW